MVKRVDGHKLSEPSRSERIELIARKAARAAGVIHTVYANALQLIKAFQIFSAIKWRCSWN